jgi:bifunctional N-acetylglucosamine-1-phosphate-uridyltransferase/glucosamine-1-phosphate-acetyltransferase GlmU-like protein
MRPRVVGARRSSPADAQGNMAVIIADADGAIAKMVEHKDATPAERAVRSLQFR